MTSRGRPKLSLEAVDLWCSGKHPLALNALQISCRLKRFQEADLAWSWQALLISQQLLNPSPALSRVGEEEEGRGQTTISILPSQPHHPGPYSVRAISEVCNTSH